MGTEFYGSLILQLNTSQADPNVPINMQQWHTGRKDFSSSLLFYNSWLSFSVTWILIWLV